MAVLVVGKTRMQRGCCIGGLDLQSGRSIRLLERDGSNPPHTTQYGVGQIWDMSYTPLHNPTPPHTEDVLVARKRLVDNIENVRDEIINRTQPHRGSVSGLHQGLLQFTGNGSGYISELTDVPAYSTCFWIPDRDLLIERDGHKVRYKYLYLGMLPRKLAYVGFTEPILRIPKGTLVRVSLARWWAPDDAEIEQRCYLQLSGWYL